MKRKDVSKVNPYNPIVWMRSYISTKKSKFKVEKVDIDKLKPPYVILSNHASDMDSFAAKKAAYPHRVYNVTDNMDMSKKMYNLKYMGDIFNENNNDSIKIRKDIKNAINSGKIVVMYPELGVSLDGATGIISDNIASFLKTLNVPVIILKNHGTYLAKPIWSNIKNGYDINSEMYLLCDKDEINSIEIDDLQEKIIKNLNYDDYGWQRSRKVAIIGKDRCNGLENILYKCPQCLEENKIVAKGEKMYCSSCGKQWEMTEYGDMRASLDEQEYTRIPDWYAYQRECVKEEILAGNYNQVYKVIVEEIADDGKVLLLEPGILWHSNEGFILKYSGRGKEETIMKSSESMATCHIMFNHRQHHKCVCIRENGSNLYVYSREEALPVTKIKLAVEELYKLVCESKLFVEKTETNDKEEAVTVDIKELIESEDKIESDNAGKVIAIEYFDDNVVTKEQAMFIREQAKTVETDEVP